MNIHTIFAVFFLLLVMLNITVIFFLPDDLTFLFIKEWGPVENAQVILYVTGALVSWIYAKRNIWAGGYQGCIILLIFAMRELDFQKKFTGISITRTKYYFHSDAALLTKIMFACIVVCIVVFIIVFVRKNFSVLLHNVRARKNWALSVLAGLLSMLFAFFVDGSTRILETLGIESVKHEHLLKNSMEELFELAIPFFFLNALLLYGKSDKGNYTDKVK
ncbi:MAG: hypothetical protein AB1552_03665 [Nitrospirota bacterium]